MTFIPNYFHLNDDSIKLFNEFFAYSSITLNVKQEVKDKVELKGSISYDYVIGEVYRSVDLKYYLKPRDRYINFKWKVNSDIEAGIYYKTTKNKLWSHALMFSVSPNYNTKFEVNNFFQKKHFNFGLDARLENRNPILESHFVIRRGAAFGGVHAAIDPMGNRPWLWSKMEYSAGVRLQSLLLCLSMADRGMSYSFSAVNTLSAALQFGSKVDWSRAGKPVYYSMGVSYMFDMERRAFIKCKLDNMSQLVAACGAQITKVEEALTPFIRQVESLLNLRQVNSCRPLSQYSLCKACENVNMAVLGFIATAENIAANYTHVAPEIRSACSWSRSLVSKILDNTLYSAADSSASNDDHSATATSRFHSLNNRLYGSHSESESGKHPGQYRSLDNRGGLSPSNKSGNNAVSLILQPHSNATFGQFAEGLMTAIERILLLADWLVVLDVRRAIVKVIQSLSDLDSRGTENFPSFMHIFSRFGADMVELGELSGQRQMDLKNSQLRCLVALVRSMLERTTMMILAVWKINFRHDGRLSRNLRSLTFQHANHLLDLLMAFLVVSHPLYVELSPRFRAAGPDSSGARQAASTADPASTPPIAAGDDIEFLEKESQNIYQKIFTSQQIFMWELLNRLKALVSVDGDNPEAENERAKMSLQSRNDIAVSLVSDLLSCGQHFTQCSFVSLPERQHIISLCRRLRVQLRSCFERGPDDSSGSGNADKLTSADQARLFVEDICDQVLAAIFNISVKYGDDVICACLRLPQESENGAAATATGGGDDRKPPRSGSSNHNPTPGSSDEIAGNSNSAYKTSLDLDLQSSKIVTGTMTSASSSRSNSSKASLSIGILKLKMISVCEFLAQVSMSREISVVCILTRDFIDTLAQMINLSVQIYQEISTSKHAKDCADVLLDIWCTVISDVANIKSDIVEWRQQRYSSQHRPQLAGYYDPVVATLPSSDTIMRSYHRFLSDGSRSSGGLKTSSSAPASPGLNSASSSSTAGGRLSSSGTSRFFKPVRQLSPSFLQQHYPQYALQSSSSIHSLDKDKFDADSAPAAGFLPVSDSPNPWLSVSEIERIVFMKGRVVIDLATQIAMFSHNEGPIKTSVELMETVQQIVRELANFHGFAERNIINDQMLPELDRLPALISSLCSVQTQPASASRAALFAKIDRLVQLTRISAAHVTGIITSWRAHSDSIGAMSKPVHSKSFNSNRQDISTPPNISNSSSKNNARFFYDEIPDNKGCFSDTGAAFNAIYSSSSQVFNGSRSYGQPENI